MGSIGGILLGMVISITIFIMMDYDQVKKDLETLEEPLEKE